MIGETVNPTVVPPIAGVHKIATSTPVEQNKSDKEGCSSSLDNQITISEDRKIDSKSFGYNYQIVDNID